VLNLTKKGSADENDDVSAVVAVFPGPPSCNELVVKNSAVNGESAFAEVSEM
jgi:hypothetical protein